jgi:RNA-binding protein
MTCGTEGKLKGPIQSVEVTYLLHATEDPDRVSSAVNQLLSVRAEHETEVLEGHFGNKIVLVRFHLTGEDAATAVDSLASQMTAETKDYLKNSLDEIVDEHSALFLRLDKQKMVEGTLAEGSADPVRVKVKPRVFLLRGGAKEFYVRLLFGGS